jgi:hypothetical protein
MSDKDFFRYFVSKTLKPLRSFRAAQNKRTGLWTVYGSYAESPAPAGSEEAEDAAAMREGEVLIAPYLRTFESAERAITVSSMIEKADREAVPLLWSFFEIEAGMDANGIYPTHFARHSYRERIGEMMTETVRNTPLELYGNVACTRRDIVCFELAVQQATIAIFVTLKRCAAPLLCKTFSVGELAGAEATLADYVRRANAQVFPADIEMFDTTPISPLVLQAEADKQKRDNLTKLTEVDPNKPLLTEEEIRRARETVTGDDDDSDADVDDKVPAPKEAEAFIQAPSATVTEKIEFV